MNIEHFNTLPSVTAPTQCNTGAFSLSNQSNFIEAISDRKQGLYTIWQNWQRYETTPDTCDRLPKNELIDESIKIFRSEQGDYIPYRPDISAYGHFTKSIWKKRYRKIDELETAWKALKDIFHLENISEEEIFILRFNLQKSIDVAFNLIEELFAQIETKTHIYTDPDEPGIKLLNITLHVKSTEESEIDGLLDKYDELQERFIEVVDTCSSSKICFYLDI
nr:hypothetical protein [Desulfobulbaceae bacterium]